MKDLRGRNEKYAPLSLRVWVLCLHVNLSNGFISSHVFVCVCYQCATRFAYTATRSILPIKSYFSPCGAVRPFMQASVVALVLFASAWIPLLLPLRNSSLPEVPPEPVAIVGEEPTIPECVCLPAEGPAKGEGCEAPASGSTTGRVVAATVGALGGSLLTVVHHGRANRAGPEAGAAVGDPIPW